MIIPGIRESVLQLTLIPGIFVVYNGYIKELRIINKANTDIVVTLICIIYDEGVKLEYN